MSKLSENRVIEDYDFTKQEQFASLARQALRDITKSSDGTSTTFSTYDKDQILNYLKSPESNAANLRKASMQMYQNSSQYRRLIQYHAYMPTWAYTTYPLGYNPSKTNKATLEKQYYKAIGSIENMHLKHELQKALLIAYREGVLYGAVWSNSNSWFIQRINPDYCQLSSIEDGTWNYCVDMSKLKETDLFKYPPEFETMYREYEKTGQRWQEVPAKISFCLKADETVTYPIPPFASVLPAIFDLENYKELAEVATELSNYKLLAMQVPLNDDGQPSMPWELIMQFYKHLANSLPDRVGAAALPMKLDSINFEKSNTAQQTDELEVATRNFWYSSGTSPLLFGDAANTTSAALNLSIKTDEELVLASVAQCERLVNRHLKQLSGSVKFQISILPITVFNQEKMISYYKEAATYGLPTKLAYCAAVGIQPTTVEPTVYLENDLLNLTKKFVPLTSTHTQSSGGSSAGRPAESEEDLTESGEQTRENDSNESKE